MAAGVGQAPRRGTGSPKHEQRSPAAAVTFLRDWIPKKCEGKSSKKTRQRASRYLSLDWIRFSLLPPPSSLFFTTLIVTSISLRFTPCYILLFVVELFLRWLCQAARPFQAICPFPPLSETDLRLLLLISRCTTNPRTRPQPRLSALHRRQVKKTFGSLD